MTYKILFIEDDVEMQSVVIDVFRKECVVSVASSIKEAREKLAQDKYDLILSDLSLPDGEGFKICNHIRQIETLKDTPVIVLSGRTDIEDKEMAFSLGADDYILKPVESRELRARVIFRLERARSKKDAAFFVGNLKFLVPLQKVFLFAPLNEVELDLTSHEFKILYHFATHVDHVFSRDQLLTAIWGDHINLQERTIDTHISNLRKKIKAAGANGEIVPVRGLGYKFSVSYVPLKKSS